MLGDKAGKWPKYPLRHTKELVLGPGAQQASQGFQDQVKQLISSAVIKLGTLWCPNILFLLLQYTYTQIAKYKYQTEKIILFPRAISQVSCLRRYLT